MSEKEKAKEILREVRDDMMDFREILGFPALRRPILQLREQMKFISQMPQVRPQLQSRQTQPPDEEVRRKSRRETLPQLPQLPLPVGLKERIERFRAMPIRRGIGEVLRSYSEYISSPRQRKRGEEEEAYEEREKDVEASKMAQARLRRKGIYKEHGIEM